MNSFTLTVIWLDGHSEVLHVLGDTLESATRIAARGLPFMWQSLTVEHAQ
jgi:hypothetical protein